MNRTFAMLLVALGSAGYCFAGVAVPEVDPATGFAALTLLCGATLVLRARRRKS